MDDKNDLKNMVMLFRVSELQLLLGLTSQSRCGRKTELTQRALNLIDKGVSPQVQQKIKELYQRFIPRTSSSSSLSSSMMSANKMPNPNNMSLGKAGGSGSIAGIHKGLSALLNLHNGNVTQNTPVYPEVRYKHLPFYDVLSDILKPLSLIARSSSKQQEVRQTFTFTEDQIKQIYSAREPLPNNRVEFKVQVQLRFCVLDLMSRQPDCFPSNICVKVNGAVAPLPNLIPTNKPGAVPRRPGRPVDITNLCRFSTSVSNNLNIAWTIEDNKNYCAVVYMVRKLDSNILLQRLKRSSVSKPDQTKQLIKDKLTPENDHDLALTSLRVSLLCPLGKMRMSIPCRSLTCDHLQCFDAITFLQMNEKKPTWMCPVCDRPADFNKLTIDGFISEIIKETIDSTEIELSRDGQWCVTRTDDVTDEKNSGDNSANSPNYSHDDSTNDHPNPEEVIDLTGSDDEDFSYLLEQEEDSKEHLKELVKKIKPPTLDALSKIKQKLQSEFNSDVGNSNSGMTSDPSKEGSHRNVKISSSGNNVQESSSQASESVTNQENNNNNIKDNNFINNKNKNISNNNNKNNKTDNFNRSEDNNLNRNRNNSCLTPDSIMLPDEAPPLNLSTNSRNRLVNDNNDFDNNNQNNNNRNANFSNSANYKNNNNNNNERSSNYNRSISPTFYNRENREFDDLHSRILNKDNDTNNNNFNNNNNKKISRNYDVNKEIMSEITRNNPMNYGISIPALVLDPDFENNRRAGNEDKNDFCPNETEINKHRNAEISSGITVDEIGNANRNINRHQRRLMMKNRGNNNDGKNICGEDNNNEFIDRRSDKTANVEDESIIGRDFYYGSSSSSSSAMIDNKERNRQKRQRMDSEIMNNRQVSTVNSEGNSSPSMPQHKQIKKSHHHLYQDQQQSPNNNNNNNISNSNNNNNNNYSSYSDNMNASRRPQHSSLTAIQSSQELMLEQHSLYPEFSHSHPSIPNAHRTGNSSNSPSVPPLPPSPANSLDPSRLGGISPPSLPPLPPHSFGFPPLLPPGAFFPGGPNPLVGLASSPFFPGLPLPTHIGPHSPNAELLALMSAAGWGGPPPPAAYLMDYLYRSAAADSGMDR